jgi:hypothetical protein
MGALTPAWMYPRRFRKIGARLGAKVRNGGRLTSRVETSDYNILTMSRELKKGEKFIHKAEQGPLT